MSNAMAHPRTARCGLVGAHQLIYIIGLSPHPPMTPITTVGDAQELRC